MNTRLHVSPKVHHAPLRRGSRGMAYALTMMALFVIFCGAIVGTLALRVGKSSGGNGLMNTADSARQSAVADLNEAVAYNMAESGVMYTVQWLSQQNPPPSNPSQPDLPYAPSLWNGTYDTSTTPARESMTMPVSSASDTGKFSVLIYPDIDSIGQTQKKFLIESIGTYRGVQQIIQAFVEQDSFGKYAYFTDTEPNNGVWEAGLNSFNGPVHSNDSDGNKCYYAWWSADNTSPMFQYGGVGAYSTSASSIKWLKDFSSLAAPQTNNDWVHVAAGGAATVQTGVPSVPMPSSSSIEQTAALGGATAPSGSSPSVMIPTSGGSTSGGIYIHGNASQMSLSTDSSGVVQNIEIDQTNTATSPSTLVQTFISENPTTNSTAYYTVSTQGSNSPVTSTTTTVSGVTNGVIYSDGNFGHQETSGDTYYDSYPDTNTAYNNNGANHGQDLTGGVSGTIADNYYNGSGTLVHTSGVTIATSSSNNMNIDGNLTTFTPMSSTNFVKNAGTLGLVSKTLEITTNDKNGNALNNCTVMASLLAYNTCDAANIKNRPAGTFTLDGGYIAECSGLFGLLNPSNNTMANGLAESYNYDNRLANNPPPYFPTTGTTYTILSWQRATTPIG